MGGRSIVLARVFGIRIGVHPSWFFVLFLIIWSLSGLFEQVYPDDQNTAFLLAVVSALLFFASVILHELGHALVARRNGIEIAGIDLWLFGGMARMRREGDSPGVEFRVAIAGPVVTLLVVALAAGGGTLIAGSEGFERALRFREGANGGAALLGFLAYVNALLLLFNLLPGLPLDGGRLARAAAWKVTGDRMRATRFAARLGRVFSWLLVGLGILLTVQGAILSGIWMIFIGIFLGQAARASETQAAFTSRIEGMRVADVMDSDPVAIQASTTVARALDEYFLRYGWDWFPVVDPAGRLLGLVTRPRLEEVPEALRSELNVEGMVGDRTRGAFRVSEDERLETLLGSESLQRLGALMAVDGDGVLRGVVTLDRVRRALRSPSPAT